LGWEEGRRGVPARGEREGRRDAEGKAALGWGGEGRRGGVAGAVDSDEAGGR